MTTTRAVVPTLTEVIEIASAETAPTEPMPLAPDSVPLEPARALPPQPVDPTLPRLRVLGAEEAARIVDAVVERLQPRLEAWVQEQLSAAVSTAVQDAVREAVQASVRTSVQEAAADMARRLRRELPALARAALDEVRPDGFES